MMNTVVLGIGNILMMDDGIGVYILEELIKNSGKDNNTYIFGETDIDYCLDSINSADRLIIIDSMYSGDIPGTIKVFPLHDEDYKGSLELSLHNINIVDVINQQYKRLEGVIIGIQVCEINYGIGLSQCLKGKFLRILRNISNIINVVNNI